ncbi:hypothetical protein NSU_0474 [Novosphingobium pentaromativorans US6-1]|uniref:Cupin 2 conserved barrel domain-containing protein n=2 Tax=Novosphingobium pentaromativorans TaxID=205844 RepID=G6E803_9SPHN|nr:hypothetical protein NSU_0474 [Novosphingobium pentaromativorans US6-1]
MMGGPRIKHVDDVEAFEVCRIEYEDGRSASIYERFVERLPNFVTFYNRWDPGMLQRTHGHTGHHMVFILSGEIWVGDKHCPAGTHIFLMHGDVFGPWRAGPEGCETLGVIAGAGWSFAYQEDDEAFVELLKKEGAKRGTVPPIPRMPYSPPSPTRPWESTEPGKKFERRQP